MDSSRLTIRPAEPADADGIAQVHIDSWRETYSDALPTRFFDGEALAARQRMWASILGSDPMPGTAAVAERGRRIIGFAFAGSARHPDARKGHDPARDLHLFSIYLVSAEHGAGTGRSLLNAVLGDRPAQLWVLASNTSAQAFYERHGFRADGIEVTDPEIDGLVDIRMVR